jgi:hypothetical protein
MDTETKRRKITRSAKGTRAESALGFSVLVLLVGCLGRRIVLQAILESTNAFRQALSKLRQFPGTEQK